MTAHASCSEFGITETHGILFQPGNEIYATSEGLGWDSMFASTQRVKPYEHSFKAVRDHLVILHLDGPASVTRRVGGNTESTLIAAGGLFVLPGGEDFWVRLGDRLRSIHVYLRKDVFDDVAQDFGLAHSGSPPINPSLGLHDPIIAEVAIGVRQILIARDAACPVYAGYLARTLAARLIWLHSTAAQTKAATVGRLSARRFKAVRDFMDAHLSESLTLDHLANVIGVTPSHFARRFKKTTGVPPHQYLLKLRLDRAAELLPKDLPIIEVALAYGFAHQEHMTRVFRRVLGTTPAEFRRRLAGQ